MERMKHILLRLFGIIQKPMMRVLPGQLAFFLVLSIVPIVTLVGYITSLFSISIDVVIEFLTQAVPREVADLLISSFEGKGIDANIIIFMVTGFVVASNGAHSVIVTSNMLYEVESGNYIKRRIKAFFLTLLLVILFIFVLFVLAFGNSILKWILNFSIFSQIGPTIYTFFVYLKWPIAFLLLFFGIKVVYTFAPDANIPSHYVNRGAIFTTFGWSLVTAIYSYYVANFSNYGLFYGSLSSLVVLMMWIYILSYIFVVGIAINTNNYQLEKKSEHNSD